jgi:hypothetical protein
MNMPFVRLFINVSVLQELMTCFGQKLWVIKRSVLHIQNVQMEDPVGTVSYLQGMSCHFFFDVKFNKTFSCVLFF